MELLELTHRDLAVFLTQMREEDKKEVACYTGKDPVRYIADTCTAAIKDGDELVQLWSLRNGDDIVAIGGYAITGHAWFLCTDAVNKCPKGFLQYIKMIRDGINKSGSVMMNCAMLSNTLHVRFLNHLECQWIGKPFEINGELFQRFIILPERER